MAVSGGGSSMAPSSPPPCPKYPPEYLDLYGKRREMAKVVMLEREIGFLEKRFYWYFCCDQEELKSVEGFQHASQCCKEIAEFVVANSEPLIPIYRMNRRSCRFWKWLCKTSSFSCSWFCCKGCSPELELPRCCDCNLCICPTCICCSLPNWQCCCLPSSCCFIKNSCCRSCKCQCSSCSDCSCITCKCSCPRCPKVHRCCKCTKICNPCCLCY